MKLKNLIATHEALYKGKMLGADIDLHEISINYAHHPEAEIYEFHPRYISYKEKIEKLNQEEPVT